MSPFNGESSADLGAQIATSLSELPVMQDMSFRPM